MSFERIEKGSIQDEKGEEFELTPLAVEQRAEFDDASGLELAEPSIFDAAKGANSLKADVANLVSRRLEASKVLSSVEGARAEVLTRVSEDAAMIKQAVESGRMDVSVADKKLEESLNIAMTNAERNLARKLSANLKKYGPGGKKS